MIKIMLHGSNGYSEVHNIGVFLELMSISPEEIHANHSQFLVFVSY